MSTYINEFKARTGNGKYPNIDRQLLVTQLYDRMARPASINQNLASLCGPACLAFAILKHSPAMYAAYIMSLYDTGSAQMHKLMIKPSDGCRNATLRGMIPEVDWVGLASLRDSENANFEYNDPSDAFPGITMPGGLEEWFKKLKFTEVREKTNLWFKKGMDDFKQAAKLFAQGHVVCLFVNDGVLYSRRTGLLSVPNHWCVLNSNPHFGKNDLISMEVFTWGKSRMVTVTADVFIGGFYGFVSGKWS